MTLNGAIMQLVEMRENSLMPIIFKPYFDKVIETVSECEEPRNGKWIKGDDCVSEYSYFCNQCKAHHRARYDYCPSCGSKMD